MLKVLSRINSGQDVNEIDQIRTSIAKLPPGLRTRFAPSPTGHLHLGHIASAIFTWGIAQAIDAQVIVRIEDHDVGRCRQEYIDSIIDDLEWFGFLKSRQTLGPLKIQSDNFPKFEDLARKLGSQSYYCQCSRKSILEQDPTAFDHGELRYPNICRDLHLESGKDRGLRLILDEEDIGFDDLCLGEQKQCPQKQCGDLLLRDRHSYWSYQFAVSIDDWQEDIDLVIRGQDLLSSTGRQIQLAKILGRENPAQFLHHPLIVDQSGKKLSKRDRASSVKDLRDQGYKREDILLKAWKFMEPDFQDSINSVDELGKLFK